MLYTLNEKEDNQFLDKFLNTEFNLEKELSGMVELAARMCGAPAAIMRVIRPGTGTVLFQYAFNLTGDVPRYPFCDHVINQRDTIIINDAKSDSRYKDFPFVAADPNHSFYAGVPLMSANDVVSGSLCVMHYNPLTVVADQEFMLKALSRQIIQLLAFDDALKIMKDLDRDNKELEMERRSFFESSIDQHLLLGRNFEILSFNRTWDNHVRRTYGLEMEKGRSMIDYIKAEHLHDFYRDYAKALKGTAVYDERNLRQDGKDYWRLVKFEPALHTDGTIIGVSINVADVNSKVKHAETVRLQDEKLKEIAFIQSHEFRKPVASIMALMQLIDLDGRNDDLEEWSMLQRAVKELEDKIQHIVGSINDK